MTIITPNTKIVKRKIQEVGEKPCYQYIYNVQNQNQGVVFPTSVDINVKMDQKKPHVRFATGGILTSLMNSRYFLDINLAYDHKNAVGGDPNVSE